MKRNYFMMASDSEDSCELQPATKKSVAPQNSFGTFNGCLTTAPFGIANNSNKTNNKNSIENINFVSSKKNLQQWLRLQEIYNRIQDSEEDEDNTELYITYGDRLCDVFKFTEAFCAYGQALVNSKPSNNQEINHEFLIHFTQVVIKLITKVQIQHQEQQQPRQNLEPAPNSKTDFYIIKAGEPSFDPLSCPFCYGVLIDPVTLPCGHSFCRNHVINSSNPSLCFKCKTPWRRQEPRLICTPSGNLERQQSKPEDDLKMISTNTIVNTLVHKYWSSDLKISDIRTKANKMYSTNQLSNALELYNEAFGLDPTDHLVLGNRSITHLKMGHVKAALEDAETAVRLRPDWAKGHLRKASAHRLLGNHSEAFKAFYNCLTLENGQSRPVKLELAKEMFQLLKTAAARVSCPDSDSDSMASSDSSGTSLSDMGTFRRSNLPECLVELGNFLDKKYGGDSLFEGESNTTKGKWLLVTEESHKMSCRAQNQKVESSDYECPLCMRLLWNPITTPCGHTFCKICLDRVLDHNTTCPMCKSATLKTYLSDRKETYSTEFVEYVMKKFLLPEYEERKKIHENEMQKLAGQTDIIGSYDVPIFVCTLSFPNISCPLHVFEPRYRLMIRRCMEVGTREFGMCMHVNDGKPFSDYGTMLEIRDIQFFDDGRSIVDTMGSKRFKVLNRSILDGYNTAQIEFLEDDPIPEDQIEELKKLHDETLQQAVDWFEGSATSIRSGIIANYGSLPEKEYNYWTTPNGPTWSWWLLNIIPVDPALKVQLLSSTSLKKRLENLRRILKILFKAGNRKPNN